MVQDRSAPMLLVKLRTNDGEFRVVTDEVLSFKYTDRERKADLAVLEVRNDDLTNFDDPVWRKGGILVVQWGYPGAMSPARECVITGVKGFRKLNVEATARSVEMNTTVKSRTFDGQTIGSIVRTIATENGYTGDRLHIEDPGEVIEVVTQGRLTDAQFLKRWASRLGFEFYVDFDGFHFHPRRLGEAPVRKFRYHTDPGQGDILEDPEIENDLTAKPGKVRMRGRDPHERTDIDESADNESDNRESLAHVIEMIDPETGNATMVENRLASEDTRQTADDNSTAARRRARAGFQRAQQTAVKMKLPVMGDPLLFAKTVIEIEGMGKRLSIKYYITEVEHDLSPSGYTCSLSLVSDGHGGHSTTSSRADGLSLADGGTRGAGSGSGINGEVLHQLQACARIAHAESTPEVAASLDRAVAAYRRGGNRARAEVSRILASTLRSDDVTPTLRDAIGETQANLVQRGPETASGGRVNNRDAATTTDDLEPVDSIDPESGRTVTSFRQTPARGSAQGD